MHMIDDKSSAFKSIMNSHHYADNITNTLLAVKLANHSSGFSANSSMMTVREFVNLCTPTCYSRYSRFVNYIKFIYDNPLFLIQDILSVFIPALITYALIKNISYYFFDIDIISMLLLLYINLLFIIILIRQWIFNNDRKRSIKYREKDIKSFIIYGADDSIIIDKQKSNYLDWVIYFPNLLGVIRNKFDKWKVPDYTIYFSISRWYDDAECNSIPGCKSEINSDIDSGIVNDKLILKENFHEKTPRCGTKVKNIKKIITGLIVKYDKIILNNDKNNIDTISDVRSSMIFLYDIMCEIGPHDSKAQESIEINNGLKTISPSKGANFILGALNLEQKKFSNLEGWFREMNRYVREENLKTLKP